MNSKMLFLALILGAFISVGVCDHHEGHDDHNHQAEEQAVFEKLTKGYNVNIRPASLNGTNGPVTVKINIHVLNVQKIDEEEGTWRLQIFYRQEWNDNRLAYDDGDVHFPYLTMTSTDSIWTPDIFFSNELHAEVHNLMKKNAFIRIRPNGDVLYSKRLTLTLFCPQAIAKPRKSEIVCPLKQASYAYTNDDISILWKDENTVTVSDIAISHFTYTGVVASSCESTTSTGTYSCALAEFTFRRSECVA